MFGPEAGGVANQIVTISVPSIGVQGISIGRDEILYVDPLGVNFQGKARSIGGQAIKLSQRKKSMVQ